MISFRDILIAEIDRARSLLTKLSVSDTQDARACARKIALMEELLSLQPEWTP